MSKVDWSLAPEGATHYCDGAMSGFWRDLSERTWKFFRDSDRTWHDSGDKTSSLMHNSIGLTLIPRPQPKPWSGPEDGLPPVGLPVKRVYSYGANKLIDSKVLAHSPCGKYGAYADECGMNWAGAMAFRAIKTPEQIAEDQRETAIRELMDIAQVDCRVTAARLVDAGFNR